MHETIECSMDEGRSPYLSFLRVSSTRLLPDDFLCKVLDFVFLSEILGISFAADRCTPLIGQRES